MQIPVGTLDLFHVPTSTDTLSNVTVTVVPLSEQTPLLPNIKPVVAAPAGSPVLEFQVLYSTVVRSTPEKSCNIRFKPSWRGGFGVKKRGH